MPKYTRKVKLGTPALPPKALQDREAEHFVLWARDGGRIAEIEIPSFRPRVEVLLWEGRSFTWHEKTRRFVEAVSSQQAEKSFQFDSGEPED